MAASTNEPERNRTPLTLTKSPTGDVTQLLHDIANGSATAPEQLITLVYRELRSMAAGQLRGAGPITLQPTALVHEAWLKLSQNRTAFVSRSHFLGVAAKAIRSALVDHLRMRNADKRGGGKAHSPLDATIAFLEGQDVDLLDLDAAMRRLEEDDKKLVRWVEMRFFAGMTHAEIAMADGCSEATVERGWRLARARLRSLLGGAET